MLSSVLMAAMAYQAIGGRERNVITETPPFYRYHSRNFSEVNNEQIIAEVREFAGEHGMDFLLSRDGPEMGDFNASANGANLNLAVLHVKAVGGGLEIFAISRRSPTQGDWVITRSFTCRIARECSP